MKYVNRSMNFYEDDLKFLESIREIPFFSVVPDARLIREALSLVRMYINGEQITVYNNIYAAIRQSKMENITIDDSFYGKIIEEMF